MSVAAAFQPLSLTQLFDLELPEVEWAVDELLPLGTATLLSAREKAGKGLLALDLCAAVAGGEPFLDRAVREGPTIYCAAEEHLRDVRQRIATRLGDRHDIP
jgi:RecA-family ATPase